MDLFLDRKGCPAPPLPCLALPWAEGSIPIALFFFFFLASVEKGSSVAVLLAPHALAAARGF